MSLPREQLLDAFQADLREYLDGMRAVLTKLERSRDAVTTAELDEVHRQAHGLRAAARACDFATVEQIGKRLEQFFGAVRKGNLRPDRDAIAAVRGTLEAIVEWSLKLSEQAGSIEPIHTIEVLDRLLGQSSAKPASSAQAVRPQPKEDHDLKMKLQAAFEAEYKEHLETIRSLLAGIGPDGPAPGQIDEIFRRAHSLKGAARIAEVGAVEIIAHRLETLFARAREGGLKVDPDIVRAVHLGLDAIEDAATGDRASPPSIHALAAIEKVLAGAGEQAREAEKPAKEPDRPVAAPQAAETLRVSADHLNQLLRSAGEFPTEALHLDRVGQELTDLARQIDTLAKEGDSVRRTTAAELRRLAETPQFAPVARYLAAVEQQVRSLVTTTRNLRRRHRRSVWVMQQFGARFQQDVRRVRMVSADSVFQGFHKMVRDLARDEGKEVEFRATGLETLADRAVLHTLKDPIMHLLLNAVTHGVERPEERTNRGKLGIASVSLRLEAVGTRLRVGVEDDGRGIDPKAIAETAIRRGLLTATETGSLPAAELARLVFRPGFSTAQKVTGVSGRGMGLSVVHEAALQLQGEVDLLPSDGPGTRIVVSVPLSVATQRLLLVSCGGQTYAIPFHAVERLIRAAAHDIETVEGRATLVLEGHSLPVVHLTTLLGTVGDTPDAEAIMSLAILRAGGRRTAVVVDSFLSERDAFVKPLDGATAQIETLAGGLILEDGAVALVLNPATLLGNANGQAPTPTPRSAPPVAKKAPTVLVVDDSLTTRTLEKSILEVHGYTVRLAVDGMEALAKLRAEPVDLVITDVEMPRMNGFRLIEEMKKDPKLAQLPVIVVTSLAKREDQERGLALGADAYIVKRKFDHQDLLDTIRQIL